MSLRDGGGHLRGEAGGERGEGFGGGFVGEQPVAEFADGEVGDGGEGGWLVRVEDEAGDLVGLVRDDRFVEEVFEGQVGEGELGGDAFLAARRGDAGELVAGAEWGGAGEEVGEGFKRVADAGDGVGVGHCALCLRVLVL